jgi:hypothetical protein
LVKIKSILLRGKVLFQFFICMIDSWDLMVWRVVTWSTSRLFSLGSSLVLNTWVSLWLLLLTIWNSIVSTLSNTHVLCHTILSIIPTYANYPVLSEWILFVLRSAKSIQEAPIDILTVATMGIEFRNVVLGRFRKCSPAHVWHTVLINDISFKLLILRPTNFLTIITNKHYPDIFLASMIAWVISCWRRASNFNLFDTSCITSYFRWLLVMEATLIHHVVIAIWILIRVS